MNPLDVVIPAPATGFLAYAWLLIAIPLAVGRRAAAGRTGR